MGQEYSSLSLEERTQLGLLAIRSLSQSSTCSVTSTSGYWRVNAVICCACCCTTLPT